VTGRVTTARAASHLTVTGVVQGVGFRPFVNRLALRHALAGWVRNTAGTVEIEVEGAPRDLEEFAAELRIDAPPLARIQGVRTEPITPRGGHDFAIIESCDEPGAAPAVPADVALCKACAKEFDDPRNRRFMYPFITCTDCGPRHTVIERLPYDRARTSMRAFPLCRACASEYATPGDRRHHAESISCPTCGPRLWAERGVTAKPERAPAMSAFSALAASASWLRDGLIVAIRGMGGFHLAADATNDAAVRRLRERKGREAKPFAVMVRSIEDAHALGVLSADAKGLLVSAERPVVLVPAREGAVAPSVAPGLSTIGLLLPSTPLHLLLLGRVGRPLVMTSGNLSEEPIAADNDEARARLGNVADGFLLHDREITARVDDSVVRPAASGPILLRRARGHAPLPIHTLPATRPILAVGAELKHTFALARGDTTWVSPHLGDLSRLETLEHARATLAHFGTLLRFEPEVVAHDLHPGYLSTRWALETGLPAIGVQHHHAHIAAVLAEHGLAGPAVGLAFDGTGYGEDGHIWGAEVLVADLTGYRRVAHLRYVPLAGGDRAIRSPWRSLAGFASLDPALLSAVEPALATIDPRERRVCAAQIASRLNAPMASSMGRLFDAAACLLGLRLESQYEGQAAMELEACAGRRRGEVLPFPLLPSPEPWVLDPIPLLLALAEGRRRGDDPADLAASFHETVARAAIQGARAAADASGLDLVVCSGGSFQNARLLDRCLALGADAGLVMLRPHRLSPNDGAISFGQAAVAAARLSQGAPTVPPAPGR
jgi:hydrogenase maturation protein HypF